LRVEKFARERAAADTRAISFGDAMTVSIEVGGTPVPVAAPPEVELEDVTKGYVP